MDGMPRSDFDGHWDGLVERLLTQSPRGLAAVVLEMVRCQGVPFQSCVVLLSADGRLEPFLSETPFRDVLAMSHLLNISEPLVDEVLSTSQARLACEIPESSSGRIFKDEGSAICLPLIACGHCLGVLYLGAIIPGTYGPKHLAKLAKVAGPTAQALAAILPRGKDVAPSARPQEKAAQLQAFRELGRRLVAAGSLVETHKIVVTLIRRMIPQAQSVIVFARDLGSSAALRVEYADTPYADYVRNLALRDDEGVLGQAIRVGQTILVEDTDLSDGQNLIGAEHSLIVAPLLGNPEGPLEEYASSRLIALLYVGAVEEHRLTEDHRAWLEAVCYLATMAFKNALLEEQVKQLASTDGLTGLFSHRLFLEMIAEEIEYAERHERSVVLIMLDADNFKRYNDTLGHRAGDVLLKEIAALLMEKVKASDIVCRYGGDEFALMLKNTSKEQAARLGERVREAFQLRFGGNQVPVTASIGLACYPVDADSRIDLFQAAEDALYVSKRAGRNRVSVSKSLEVRRREGPMMKIGGSDEPPWEHPQTSPRKPPPKNVPGGSSRRLD